MTLNVDREVLDFKTFKKMFEFFMREHIHCVLIYLKHFCRIFLQELNELREKHKNLHIFPLGNFEFFIYLWQINEEYCYFRCHEL